MLRFLFPGLTSDASRGSALFGALVTEARQEHWFTEGGVPDTIDGRFAVLATVTALATVRLERGGAAAGQAAVALAERFVEAMDSEHRQLGLGDPSLGKTVRKLMGALGRRVELWRSALEGGPDWTATAADSLFRSDRPGTAELDHCGSRLRGLWSRLDTRSDEQIAQGSIG